MKCLESLAPQPDNIPDVDFGIIGGAAFVWVWNMNSIWSSHATLFHKCQDLM